VPEKWIRAVMRQESGGRVAATSRAGAAGLMQVMPSTYAALRARHGLGNDPYHPYDNIMAGVAYIREMYELYGSPAFLVAYNAGPRRLEEYLYAGRGLPEETRNYVSRIGPVIAGYHPRRQAPPEVIAAAEIQLPVPPGPRGGSYGPNPTALAAAQSRSEMPRSWTSSSAPAPETAVARVSLQPPVATEAPQGGWSSSSFVGPAGATTLPRPVPVFRGPAPAAVAETVRGGWSIQVGAYAQESTAQIAAAAARERLRLSGASPSIQPASVGRTLLWRARLGGLTRETAEDACGRYRSGECLIVPPAG